MNKWFTKLLSTALLVSATAFAGDAPDVSVATEVQQLKLRLQELEQRLADREAATQVSTESASAVTVASQESVRVNEDSARELRGFALLKDALSEVSIGGNVDVVGYYSDHNTNQIGVNEDTSEVFIDQVRLNVQVDVNDYVKGFVGLQFEDYQRGSYALHAGGTNLNTEDDGDVQVDEAHITISGEEGLYTIAGKQYFAFGNVADYGNFINDTLARQLYETRDTGVAVGYKAVGLDFSAFAFNGALEEARTRGWDNKIDTWGGAASYSTGDEERSFKLGVSYIDNILQAQNSTARAGLDVLNTIVFPALVRDGDSAGINGYIVASMGPLWLSGEYVAAINDVDRRDTPPYPLGGTGKSDQRPEAYTVEAAFTTPLADRDYTLAVKWEENNDQDQWGNAVQNIWGVGASTELFENTKLTLNWENWQFEERVGVGAGAAFGGRADVYLAEVSVKF